MIFSEASRIMRLISVIALGALLIHSGVAQEKSTSVQSAESLAKKLKPSDRVRTDVRIEPVQSRYLVRSLSENQHALMSVPPEGIASALTNVNLPSTSPKRFSFPGVSKTDFLAPTRVKPTEWKHLNPPKVNAAELRSDKHPNLATPE